MEYKKLVLFGAGKIGRSFIGQLFSRSGYEIVFIEIDDRIVAALNKEKRYKVVIKSNEGDEDLWVENVRGFSVHNEDQVVEELTSARIMAISVGKSEMLKLCPLIAKGLLRRASQQNNAPLDIILAENMRNAAPLMRKELMMQVPSTFPLDDRVGLIETSIGKMVPIMPVQMSDEDPLLVYAEPFNSLIVDRHGFKNTLPEVKGLEPKDNISAWVDRKFMIHNLGHAAAAYYGYVTYPGMSYLYEVLAKDDAFNRTRDTMLQGADLLMKHYPGEFTKVELVDHIDDLLERFSNKALGDTIFRVGQDLYRKLGPEDRLVKPLKMAIRYGSPYDKILYVIVCAIKFEAADEKGCRSENDKRFTKEAVLGISHILEMVCDISKEEFPEVHYEANAIRI